ncbi:MAG TPA: M48 family metallopeptidase, partial [Gemmatimonadaceae bacterium]|nr:M48 family metallopeptidase [Gemmatimonadaceae bacterium]
MAITYPIGPTSVPADLTLPPPAYRRRLWLALGGLLLFAASYVALTAWLGWTAYRLLTSALQGGENSFWGFVVGGSAALLTVFMVKGFFFIKQGRADKYEIEVTATDQPQLFAFLRRLADDAKAPRPHRVFLSPRVNASVSYDLSLINFIIPSKKNLEIGLGLVNVLTLGELTAVLAHEFGHFTQRSMAVGRWVYIAQQIAAQIVARRDKFDAFLNRWTRVDVRIAWVGWLLSIIVWSIRSLVDSLFSVALRMQRALAREMEMHADLVAVSLTGSDSLIYALHRLRTADDAWDRTLAFAGAERAKGHLVKDLFAIQLRLIERLSLVDAEMYRSAPALPETQPQALRLFKAELAQPPRMWSTHPPNDEREVNAKRVYIPA